MKRLSILLIFLFLTGCAVSPSETREPTLPTPMTEAPQPDPTETTVPATTTPPDPIQEVLDSMTIEERVGQLFLARCNAESALTDIQAYHLGGFVLFGEDFEGQTPSSLRQTLSGYQAAASIPLLLAVDEEGGTVTRISRYPVFRPQRFPSPREAFADGGLTQALSNEEDICQLLQSLGINVNLGPVCDISEDPSAFMYQRSLGQDAETTGEFVAGTVRLMNAYQIGSVLKHFPGYGDKPTPTPGWQLTAAPCKNWKATICSPSPPELTRAVVRCWSATTSFRHWTETPPPPSPPRSINISGTPWALTAWS